MPLNMNVSKRGLDLIAEFEGFVDHLYNDPVGHCTVGIGHLLHHGNCDGRANEAPYRNGISYADAIALKKRDAERYVKGVNDAVTVPLNQNQFDALVSWAFNLGVGALQQSEFLVKLNQGNYAAVPPDMMLYNKAGGNVLEGLVRRRQAEVDLWNTTPDGRGEDELASAEYTKLSERIDGVLSFTAAAAKKLQEQHEEQVAQIKFLSKVVVELDKRTISKT